MTSKLTLVTGAGGFIGSRLVDELLSRDEPVRAFVHRYAKAAEFEDLGAEVVVGDIRDQDVVAAAMKDADVVHHCASASRNYSDAEIRAINLDGLRNVIDAIDRRGSGRLVLLSGVNALGHQNFDAATEDHPCKRSGEVFDDVKIDAEHERFRWV